MTNTKQLKFMSMEQLDRLRRNEGEDEVLRQAASDHLAKREHEAFCRGRHQNGLSTFRRQHYPS